MDIDYWRSQIDDIDKKLLELLCRRLEAVDKIGEYKAAHAIPVKDEGRQNDILKRVSAACPPEYAEGCKQLYASLFDISCARQRSKSRFALIGGKLAHSYSKELHSLFGDYTYDMLETDEPGLKELLTSGKYSGFNVTIPHKLAAYSLCNSLSDEARATGSVNTVICSGGKLHGYNTDCYGFRFLLDFYDIKLSGKRVILLGSGGASKTVLTVARESGARAVTVISRSGSNNYGNIKEFCDYEIIINTTPVGMFPQNGASPLDIADFPKCEAVVDLIYNPLRTELMLSAQSRGIKTAGGLLMLCAQGAKASELFTGQVVKKEKIIEAYNALLSAKQNIVIIGMPGSGKSALARLIGASTGREVIDTDDEIIRSEQKSIEDIFNESGEEGFRKIEAEVIARCARLSGKVIACGGGAVILQENRRALKQNGAVIYLKRSVEKLQTEGRPLSTDINALKELFSRREPIYNEMCDIVIDAEGAGLI